MSLNQIVLNQAGWFTDWYVFQQPLGVADLLHRRDRRGEPDPVRPDRGRLGDRRRLRDRVLGDALRLLLLRRVRERLHHLGADRRRSSSAAGTRRSRGRGRSPSSLDPGQLGIGLLILVAVVPLVLTLRLRGAVLDRELADQGLAGAARRLRPRQPVRGRGSSAPAPTSASTGSPACSGSWSRRTSSCSLRLDARDAAARPDRPADGLRLEVAAAGVAAQPVRDGGAPSSWSTREDRR